MRSRVISEWVAQSPRRITPCGAPCGFSEGPGLFLCPFFVWQIKAFPEVALEGVDENRFLWLSRNETPIGTPMPCSHQNHRAQRAPCLVTLGVFKDKRIWTYTLALAFSGCVALDVYIDFSSPQCLCEMRSPQTVGRTRDFSRKGEFSGRLFPLLLLHVTGHSALLSYVGCWGSHSE